MKKYSIYALMSAIALAGTVGFSSCSSEDEVINNPDYNPDAEVVKTQFAISLPSNVNAANTRQSATTVQKTDGSFRGMQDIVLVPFITKPNASTAKKVGSDIELANIGATSLNTLNGPGTSKYKVYSNVTIPIGTSAFLFYAQALRGTDDPNFIDGSTIKNVPDPSDEAVANTAAYTFSPKPIYDGTTTNTKGENIATYLTNIANATGWSIADNTGLKDLYDKFILNTAGSSAAIQRVVTDLWNAVKPLATDAVAAAVIAAIENNTYASVSGGNLTFQTTVDGYPGNLNLPDGAAAVKWQNNKFVVDNDGTTVGSLSSYVYPAALWYTANTSIKVSTSKKANDEGTYPSERTTWDENATTGVLSLYDETGAVSSSTRSVALTDVIQYAVGRLDVTVKCDAATLYDRNGDPVTVNENGFPVSAILIGGQQMVDFTFSNPTGTEYTIYDKVVTDVSAKANIAVGTNYTLALETEKSKDVNIAIELTNNTGNDFIGKDGQLIPTGGKFYLTAKLGSAVATNTDNRIFKQDFYTIANLTIKTGFASNDPGLPTEGNTIGLGTATNTIPDLRTPKLELGLAVDLSWQVGHTYSVEI